MPRDQVLFFDDGAGGKLTSRLYALGRVAPRDAEAGHGERPRDHVARLRPAEQSGIDVTVTVLENARATGFNSTLLSAGIVGLFEA